MRPLRRPSSWLRAHPTVTDTALAALLLLLSLPALLVPNPAVGVSIDVAELLVLAELVPLVWRRRYPLPVLAATFAVRCAALVLGATGSPASPGVLVAVYTVAAHVPRRQSIPAAVAATAAVMGVFSLAVVTTAGQGLAGRADLIISPLMFTVAWFIGDNIARRRDRIATLEERAELLDRERADLARRAVAEERTRIARELHDVVAHGMSVMVVQAGAARRVVDHDPEQAKAALQSIEAVGRESLDEMRRLLGVLRAEHDAPAGRRPQPGVSQLDALVQQCRDAGLEVDLTIAGAVRPLAAGVDLSVYRITQEALTNVMKHAGAAHARVVLRYSDDAVEVEVVDDGSGRGATDGEGGSGLVGMRERIDLYGGELRIGNVPGGGFSVRARLLTDRMPA